MPRLLGLIFIVFVIGFGVAACWAIAAQGASQKAINNTDTFGQTPPAVAINEDNASASLSVSTMPILSVLFIIAVCAVIVGAFAWLWKTGKGKSGGSGY